MVTFLLLFTNRKSFQSISFSLWGPGEKGSEQQPDPQTHGPQPYLLHEHLELVLKVLRQLGTPIAWGLAQEVEAIQGAELALHLHTCLEQPKQWIGVY